jgi:antitoxin component of MazEF toxin-antitoxin module
MDGLDLSSVLTLYYSMVKTISKIGNSQGVIFDAALLELAHLKVGDRVDITVHEGGSLTLTPLRSLPPKEEVSELIEKIVRDYSGTLKRLS